MDSFRGSILSLLLLISLFVFPVSPFAASECDTLNSDIQKFSQNQEAYRMQVSDKAGVFSRTLFDLHGQLASLEDKSVDDLDWAMGSLGGLIESLQKFAEEAFIKASENYESTESLKPLVEKCYGLSSLAELQSWSSKNEEILSTVGGVYSLYNSRFSDWLEAWDELARNKSVLSRGEFDEVELTANEFAEAKRLTQELLVDTHNEFKSIWK